MSSNLIFVKRESQRKKSFMERFHLIIAENGCFLRLHDNSESFIITFEKQDKAEDIGSVFLGVESCIKNLII